MAGSSEKRGPAGETLMAPGLRRAARKPRALAFICIFLIPFYSDISP
jgi:hypothetical protein